MKICSMAVYLSFSYIGFVCSNRTLFILVIIAVRQILWVYNCLRWPHECLMRCTKIVSYFLIWKSAFLLDISVIFLRFYQYMYIYKNKSEFSVYVTNKKPPFVTYLYIVTFCLLSMWLDAYLSWVHKYQSTQVLSLSLLIKLKELTYVYMHGIVLYWHKFQKVTVLAQGACTLAVLRSMQPEHKTLEITNTVLKSIITQFRCHICSCWLRDKSRTVH